MPSALVVVASFGGVATRHQILTKAITGPALAAAVRGGGLTRVRRGHYAAASAQPDAVVATRVGGALCGLSAARSYGLWSGTDDRVHIALAPNASRSRIRTEAGRLTSDIDTREIVRHWIAWPPHRECWRVDIVECLRQVVAWADDETAIACLDTARTTFRFTSTGLRYIFKDEPARSRVRAQRSRAGSGSGLESIVRQRLTRLGYRIEQQVRVSGVGRVDIRIVDTRVLIEVDGREHHGVSNAFEEDRRRDAEATLRGNVVLRFTYEQIMTNWAWCESIIRSAAFRFQDPGWPTW
ncbi:MAG: DUF559 domain-containing protein [Pseudolysinimonas sp.]